MLRASVFTLSSAFVPSLEEARGDLSSRSGGTLCSLVASPIGADDNKSEAVSDFPSKRGPLFELYSTSPSKNAASLDWLDGSGVHFRESRRDGSVVGFSSRRGFVEAQATLCEILRARDVDLEVEKRSSFSVSLFMPRMCHVNRLS